MDEVKNIIRALEDYFGIPKIRKPKDPLSELVFTILSQNTTDVNRDRAYSNLRSRFPRWENVMNAKAEDIEEAIRVGGLGHQKSFRIKSILEEIHRERGDLNLDHLRGMEDQEVKDRLLSFLGVGLKTASIVMLFSLGRPAFPVDTHILRVGKRLSLIPVDLDANAAHEVMGECVPEDKYVSFHINLIKLGREICKPKSPKCDKCPVLSFCPFGREILEKF